MLFIGIPTYNGLLHWTTAKGLTDTAHYCAKKNIGFAVDVIPGDAFVGKARDIIAHRFLKSNFNELVFVDADIGFDAAGITQLCRYADVPIVMGLYQMKTPPPVRYPALIQNDSNGPVRHPDHPELIQLQYGPAGFMRIKREVFEVMKQMWPDEYYVNAGEEKIYNFFPAGRFADHFTGEDIKFCERAQQCGFPIYAAQNVKLSHHGAKAWESDWALDVIQLQEAV